MNNDTEMLVKYLRELADTIEQTGVAKHTVRVDYERIFTDAKDSDSHVITWEPTLGRVVTIRFTYKREPGDSHTTSR